MGDSKIQWTDKTWNPTRGCRRVSPGCEHCYAERQGARHSGPGGSYEGLVTMSKHGPRWTGAARFMAGKLEEPLGWKKPCRVFVDSMSDLFYEGFSNEEIAAVFGVMAACPQHTFQVLTKRPARARRWFDACGEPPGATGFITHNHQDPPGYGGDGIVVGSTSNWPLRNVWLGVSVEDQQRADERIPILLETPAAIRFVSAEPLISRVNICQIPDSRTWPMEYSARYTPLSLLDWVIVGGESGPGARPFDLAWAQLLVETCAEAGVACFVKQLGSRPVNAGRPWSWNTERMDRKGGDPEQWPPELRVRQFPDERLNDRRLVAPSDDGGKQEVPTPSGQKTPEIPAR